MTVQYEFIGEQTIQELMEELLKELIKYGAFDFNEKSND